MATKKKGSKGRRRPPSKPSAKQSPRSASNQSVQTSPESPASPTKGSPKPPASSAKPSTKPAAKPDRPKAKPERTGPTRAERIEAARRSRRRKAVLTRAAAVGVVVVLAAVVAFVVVNNRESDARTIERLEAGSCEYDTKSDPDRGAGRNHVTQGSPSYETNPPSGGDHLVTPSPAGTYTVQQLPPDGQLVHSMEHGYVILWYKPDLSPEAVNQLKGVTDKYSRDVLLVPRPSLPVPVAATAWHKRLLCQQPEPAALESFITEFRNEGPEEVPHT